MTLDVAVDDRRAFISVIDDVLADVVLLLLGQADSLVELDEVELYKMSRKVGRLASAAGVTGEAVGAREVFVLAAVAAVDAVEQPPATLGAVQASAQVVLMFPGSVAGDRTRGEDRLHPIERVRINE